MKRHLKNTLTNWVNKFISFADLINNPRSRTPENIFAIIERILELLNSMDAGMWGISSIPVKIFSPKNPSWSLVWILWTDIKRYKNNPDLLLHDLDIFDEHYHRSTAEKSVHIAVNTVDESISTFRQAFEVVIRNEIRKDVSYWSIQFDEFEINKFGYVQFSENVKPTTIKKIDIVDKIQRAFEDL